MYVIETVTIDPGYLRNVLVKYKSLPFRTDGYILEFLSRIDVSRGLLTSVFRSVLRGDKHPIFFSNFNIMPVRVYKDAVIGYLSECNIKSKHYMKVYLRYPETATRTDDIL